MIRMSILLMLGVQMLLMSCGGAVEQRAANAPGTVVPPDPMENKGIGPITSIELGEINQELVEEGKKLYEEKCTACHKVDKRYIGPAPAGIMERRTPEWVMNMILNPEEMTKNDPIAKQLLKEYLSPMANQSLTEPEARAILEYFRTI